MANQKNTIPFWICHPEMTLEEYIVMKKAERKQPDRLGSSSTTSDVAASLLKPIRELSLDEYMKQGSSYSGRGRGKRMSCSNGGPSAPLAAPTEHVVKIEATPDGDHSNFIAEDNQGLLDSEDNLDVFKSLDEIVAERGIAVCGNSASNGQNEKPDVLSKSLDEVAAEYGIPKNPSFSHYRKGDQSQKRKRQGDEEPEVANGDGNDIICRLGFSNGQARKRARVQPLTTPHRAIGFLQTKGMIIELQVGKLEEKYCVDYDLNHLWRCEVVCGVIKGVADSIRKIVAREMACADFLDKFYAAYPENVDVPEYEIPGELFIDPLIFSEIKKIATTRGLRCFYEAKIDVESGRRNNSGSVTYTCTYVVGDEKFRGTGIRCDYAKLNAAVLVYQHLEDLEYPKTTYCTGDLCTKKFDRSFGESEVFHTVELYRDHDSIEDDMELFLDY